MKQKVYLTENHLRLNQNGRSTDANIRPSEESHSARTQAAHENLQGLRSQKRRDRTEMQKVQKKEPQMEEKRTRKVAYAHF